MGEKTSFFTSSTAIPFRLVFIMWCLFVVQESYGYSFAAFGIFPRDPFGLVGIITAPWIHGNLLHIISNTFPLLFLGITLFIFYSRIAIRVFFHCYIYTGLLVWLLARPTYHIGASGVVYGLAFFLIFFGIFKRDFKSLFISIVILFFYGGLFYGILPNQPGISWESHFLGGLTGIGSAIYFGKLKRKVS
jgi:membrane associated rhomboid family serine protease